MCATAVCLATVLLGIDVGWEPLPEGGVEYRIQIEPELLENLDGSGVLVESDVPPYVRDIRAFRITVGDAELGRKLSLSTDGPSDATQVAPFDPFLPSPSSPSIPLADPLPPIDRSTPPGQSSETRPSSQNPVGTAPEDPAQAHESTPTASARAVQTEALVNPPAIPGPLPAGLIGRPLGVRQAIHVEAIDPESPAVKTPDKSARPQIPAKPWGTLIATSFALFASCGLNIYLVWIAVDFRRRYLALAGGLGANAPIN